MQEQLCEQELGHKKQFLHIQLRLHFQNKHQQCCMLQFGYGHQVTRHGIDQMLSIHLGAHFVRSLLRCNHLERHIHTDKQLVHLHKQAPYHKLELDDHKLELEHGMGLEVQRQKQQPKGQSMR